MGFLDHSTNNILIDAVLTDLGRKKLARNDGSFSIANFSVGDSEVDYTIIQQFGRTVGKEKIAKNTPSMEGLTLANLALKHPCISASNSKLTHFPVMSLVNMREDDVITLTRTGKSNRTIVLKIENDDGSSIDQDLTDSLVEVEMNHLFLRIRGRNPNLVHSDNTSVYIAKTKPSDNSLEIELNLQLKSFSSTLFNTYSVSTASYIRTYVKVKGRNSGLTKSIEVRILLS